MVATRLDVGNVPSEVDPEELRDYFSEHGEVVDLQIVAGGHAFITMATPEEARVTIEKLNGVRWNAMLLTVMEAREQPRSVSRKVRMTRQVLERCNVMYELDHSGTPLAIRMYPTDNGVGEAPWRVDASSARANGAVISASASTRTAALEEVGRAWRAQERALNLPTLDWTAVLQFLAVIRAS